MKDTCNSQHVFVQKEEPSGQDAHDLQVEFVGLARLLRTECSSDERASSGLSLSGRTFNSSGYLQILWMGVSR